MTHPLPSFCRMRVNDKRVNYLRALPITYSKGIEQMLNTYAYSTLIRPTNWLDDK